MATGINVVNLKRGYDLPERDRVDGAYPIVSSSGVTGSHNTAMVKGPGVVTGRYGTLGQVFYIPGDFWPLNTSLYVQDSKGNDPQFIRYLLQTLNFGKRSGAAAVLGVNRNDLHMLQITKPDLSTQRKIAAVLSAYDDLIENNLRRIKILEEMAQNLYREWFVKFRFPGHQRARFTDSPLGRIPEGWEVKALGELCTQMQSGGTPSRKKSEFWDGGDIDWYKTMELWDRFLFSSDEKITDDGLKRSSARLYEPGTILMAIYGSPTVGRLGIVTQHAACNQAALGMLANPILASQQFLFYALYELRGHFNSIAQGAAQQNISKAKVAAAQCVLPPMNLMEYFTNHVVPVWNLLENLQKKNNHLRRTRDLLLPRLISGEVDVSELDIAIPKEVVT